MLISTKTMETFCVFKVSCLFLSRIMRNKIIHTSADLFLSLGFKSVTMDDIAKSIGISKKTIYTHFENKTKLVQEVTFSLFEIVCEGIDTICETSENPIEELYDIKKYVMTFLKDEKASPQFQLKKYYPKIFEELQKKQFHKMHESVKESLIKGVETQLFRKDIDVDFISRLYFVGMNGIKDDTFFPKTKFEPHPLMEDYLEYHLRAIITDKGMTILNNFITKKQS